MESLSLSGSLLYKERTFLKSVFSVKVSMKVLFPGIKVVCGLFRLRYVLFEDNKMCLKILYVKPFNVY